MIFGSIFLCFAFVLIFLVLLFTLSCSPFITTFFYPYHKASSMVILIETTSIFK